MNPRFLIALSIVLLIAPTTTMAQSYDTKTVTTPATNSTPNSNVAVDASVDSVTLNSNEVVNDIRAFLYIVAPDGSAQ